MRFQFKNRVSKLCVKVNYQRSKGFHEAHVMLIMKLSVSYCLGMKCSKQPQYVVINHQMKQY